MKYHFNAYGHPNILGNHKTTLEFTKEKEMSLKGDCIIGVDADFDLEKIKEFMKNPISKKIKITIKTISKSKKIQEIIFAELNQNFNDEKELVIRKTNFLSERTFAIKANKAAFGLNKDLIGFLKDNSSKISVVIEN